MNLDPRLWREARAVRRPLAWTVGLGWAAGIMVVLQARILCRVVSQVFLEGQSLGGVGSLLAALLLMAIVRAGLMWAGEVTANRVAGQVKRRFARAILCAHLGSLGRPTLAASAVVNWSTPPSKASSRLMLTLASIFRNWL